LPNTPGFEDGNFTSKIGRLKQTVKSLQVVVKFLMGLLILFSGYKEVLEIIGVIGKENNYSH
jgi:hypothetical protein